MHFNNFDRPKNGRKFKTIGVCRISRPSQDVLSLADQEAYYREHLDRILKVDNYELLAISGRGSGQYLDREEYLDLCQKIKSGEYDMVICEDLGRIVRRIHAYVFCELAEDFATRVLAINDFVDTNDPNWRQAAFFASYRHESYCRDTSQRIQRTLRNRFREGRVFQCEIFGYVKPHAKATDSEVAKNRDAELIFNEVFDRLEDGHSYSQVANWLNANSIPTGRYCRLKKWNGAMLKRIVFNPILKGERVRNRRVTVRINRTGRPRTIPAPVEHHLSRTVPHLKFIEAERYDRLIRVLTARNAKYRRAENIGMDPRAGISRRRTRWPGQHIRCGVCGRLFVYGGHGQRDRMMCNGAREYKCWNGMTISGPDVASRVAAQIRQHIAQLPDFDREWVEAFEAERTQRVEADNHQLHELRSELTSVTRQRANRLELLDRLGMSDATVADIRACELRIAQIQDEISQVESTQHLAPSLPSIGAINDVANEVFDNLAIESEEFAQLIRQVVRDFYVLPFRLADGGLVQPKVIYTANLGALLGDHHDLPLLDITGVVDLTSTPKRAEHLADVVRMVGDGRKHADIAHSLGIFKSEVGYAMRLHRKMMELGTNKPWVPMLTADQVIDYFPRVRSSRFKFEPLEGFECPKCADD
jgi:DNA invertase Pin-like site-specific DNA recombinase